MKLKLVKASQGVVWVRQGILACKLQTLSYVGLVGMMGLLAFMLMPLPGPLGALLFVGIMPVIWMGFLLATRRAIKGQRITPLVLFEPLQGPHAPRREFAILGGVYIAASLLVQMLANWLGPDAEEVEKAIRAATSEDATTSGLGNNPVVLQSMLWRLGLTVPVTLLFWHTPALLMWGRLPVPKALFFSAVATWRNLGAFLVYGLSWLGLMLAVALLDSLLVRIFPVPVLADMLAVIASMLLAAAFYASLYFSVIDCFEAAHPGGPAQVIAQREDEEAGPPSTEPSPDDGDQGGDQGGDVPPPR